MADVYTKAKSENKNLFIANKKPWGQVNDTKIGHFFGTQWKEGEASQKNSNHWQTQVIEAKTKVDYWENKHSVVSEELVKCHRSRGQWKREVEAKEIQCQEMLKEKTAMQKAIHVLEH